MGAGTTAAEASRLLGLGLMLGLGLGLPTRAADQGGRLGGSESRSISGGGQGGGGGTDADDTAPRPPLGFNSYDAYDWTMNETQLMASAEAMRARLLPAGYDSLTLDWYWYRDGRQLTRTLPKAGLPTNTSCQIFFDGVGRMYPDPWRFPSTRACKCWTPITARRLRHYFSTISRAFLVHFSAPLSTAYEPTRLLAAPYGSTTITTHPPPTSARAIRCESVCILMDLDLRTP